MYARNTFYNTIATRRTFSTAGGDIYVVADSDANGGGGLDLEETEVQALIREFVEETGLTVAPLNRIAEASQACCSPPIISRRGLRGARPCCSVSSIIRRGARPTTWA